MGFMDKVKQQAGQATAKVEAVQAKKRQDALLRDLGAQVWAERSGHADDATAAEIERIVDELRSHEQEHGPIATAATADDTAPVGGAATATEGGEFTLDEL